MMYTKSILLITHYVPSRGHAGGLRLLDIYRIIRQQCPDIKIDLAACLHSDADWGAEEIGSIFNKVHIFQRNEFTLKGLTRAGIFDRQYDVIDLQYLFSGRFMGALRKNQPARIIFSPMESNIRSLWVDILNIGKGCNLQVIFRHALFAILELYFSLRTDAIQSVSKTDASALRIFFPRADIHIIETCLSPIEFPLLHNQMGFRRETCINRNVIFVAYFGTDANIQALKWYLYHVHPIIRNRVPGYRLVVVGRGSDHLAIDTDEQTEITGEVASIEEYLLSACVGIAPALSGAGFRGKIVQYAAASLPCVASPIAANGLSFIHGESILIAHDAASFASHCVDLLLSPQHNKTIGNAARNSCVSHYLWDNKTDAIMQLYGLPEKMKTNH